MWAADGRGVPPVGYFLMGVFAVWLVVQGGIAVRVHSLERTRRHTKTE